MEANKLSRKEFLKKSGLFAFIVAILTSRFGNMRPVKAAVLDNTSQNNISTGVIYNVDSSTPGDFIAGESVAALATKVNAINKAYFKAN